MSNSVKSQGTGKTGAYACGFYIIQLVFLPSAGLLWETEVHNQSIYVQIHIGSAWSEKFDQSSLCGRYHFLEIGLGRALKQYANSQKAENCTECVQYSKFNSSGKVFVSNNQHISV